MNLAKLIYTSLGPSHPTQMSQIKPFFWEPETEIGKPLSKMFPISSFLTVKFPRRCKDETFSPFGFWTEETNPDLANT